MNKFAKGSMALLLVAGMSACNQQPAQPSPSRPSAPVSQTPQATAPAAQPAGAGERNWQTIRETYFTTQDECEKAGYVKSMCSTGAFLSIAMSKMDSPKFKSLQLCRDVFKDCIPATNEGADGKFEPKPSAFSLGDAKTSDKEPTKDRPIFYAPLYTLKNGDLVKVSSVNSQGGVKAIAVRAKDHKEGEVFDLIAPTLPAAPAKAPASPAKPASVPASVENKAVADPKAKPAGK